MPVVATGARLVGRVGLRERARDARATPVAHLALAAVGLPVTPVGAFATIEDHRHVRVVLVVVRHLLEELGLELARDHAVDHRALSLGTTPAGAMARMG